MKLSSKIPEFVSVISEVLNKLSNEDKEEVLNIMHSIYDLAYARGMYDGQALASAKHKRDLEAIDRRLQAMEQSIINRIPTTGE